MPLQPAGQPPRDVQVKSDVVDILGGHVEHISAAGPGTSSVPVVDIASDLDLDSVPGGVREGDVLRPCGRLDSSCWSRHGSTEAARTSHKLVLCGGMPNGKVHAGFGI